MDGPLTACGIFVTENGRTSARASFSRCNITTLYITHTRSFRRLVVSEMTALPANEARAAATRTSTYSKPRIRRGHLCQKAVQLIHEDGKIDVQCRQPRT